jgi:hypothetical protein
MRWAEGLVGAAWGTIVSIASVYACCARQEVCARHAEEERTGFEAARRRLPNMVEVVN